LSAGLDAERAVRQAVRAGEKAIVSGAGKLIEGGATLAATTNLSVPHAVKVEIT
jgi:hypothetical protein